ncbi:MAG: 16S rRNA (cytosine(1402)-N(4))-methyltransferase RsmH [Planctomycetota bacterium]|nr:16S rRNA (cytosine(1402)-N(4))-methyltransferase RsmH [Planctomycetota bacterium]MDA1105844.1 16S rRNA (cytosine(1402)-N(4))-methyltransferase RsmH [Planctomycetota bacterium]
MMEPQPDHGHEPVLLASVLSMLAPASGQVAVDATAGRGGHAAAIARRLEPGGSILLVDTDASNLDHAQARVREEAPQVHVEFRHGNFASVVPSLRSWGQVVDLVLADLGFATNQVLDPARGLSFREDGPLDMRLDRSFGATAADLVAALPEAQLADIIFQFGEDPFARAIARKIAREREKNPILTTVHLAALVRDAYGPRAGHSRMHPATRTFMALRIAVNDELGALTRLLQSLDEAARAAHADGGGWLRRGARLGVISFHSLEDRLVKRWCARLEDDGVAERLVRKPVVADDTEVRHNPRARSAKFRALRVL